MNKTYFLCECQVYIYTKVTLAFFIEEFFQPPNFDAFSEAILNLIQIKLEISY